MIKLYYNIVSPSPAQTASPARKGRKGKVVPAAAEKEVVMEEKKEEVVKEKKVERKVKSAPAIIQTAEEEVMSQMIYEDVPNHYPE